MATDRPNVLVITDDQHHAACLSCEGRPQVRTPNLDRMRHDGVSFPRSYSPAPVCVPSRVSFLTGMYPHTHGIYAGWPQVPDHFDSLPTVLRTHGNYQTALVGKKHYATWSREPFDTDTGNDSDGYTRDYLDSVGLGGTWNREELAHVRDFMAYTSEIPYEHCEPVWVADQTIARIDRFDDRPFFLWSNTSAPHPPYNNSFDSPHLYDPDLIDLSMILHRDEADLRSLRQRPGSVRDGVENAWCADVVGEAKYREALAHYYGMISTVDEGVGRIISHLEKIGRLDDTIIVFTSDHGDFAGEYGMLGKNPHGAFECIHRVPLIWYWRGEFGSDRIHSFVENIDIFPTICDLLGLAVPRQVQGRSFADVLCYSGSGPGPGPQTREITYTDNSFTKGVQTRQYRLVYCFDDSEWGELYDHQVDPHERRNVYDDPAYAQAREQLTRELLKWMMATEQPIGYFSDGRLHAPNHWHVTDREPPEINKARIAAEHLRPWNESP